MKKDKWDRFDRFLDRVGIASIQAIIWGGLAMWVLIAVFIVKEFIFV